MSKFTPLLGALLFGVAAVILVRSGEEPVPVSDEELPDLSSALQGPANQASDNVIDPADQAPDDAIKNTPQAAKVDVAVPVMQIDAIESAHPFVRELQGVPHVLTRFRADRQDRVGLVPIRGGQAIWEFALPPEIRGEFLVEDDEDGLALVAYGFNLLGLELESGEVVWSVELSDRVETVGRRDGKLIVLTGDEMLRAIDPRSGEASPTQKPALAREILRDDLRRRHRSLIGLDRLLRFPGLRASRVYCGSGTRRPQKHALARKLPCINNPHGLVFAEREPGTRLPFLVGYDPKTKAERWRQPLTKPGDRQVSLYPTPETVEIGDDAIVGYRRDRESFTGRELEVMRLGLVDGSVRWQKSFPLDRPVLDISLTVADGQLLVHDGSRLQFLDPESGAVLQCLGSCEDA